MNALETHAKVAALVSGAADGTQIMLPVAMVRDLLDLADLGAALAEAEAAAPGWGWLVRENGRAGETGGYFANLTSPDFAQTVTPDGRMAMRGQCRPTYAETPGGAVRAAVAGLLGTRQ